MSIQFEMSLPPISETDLSATEVALGVRFPEDYRGFLLIQNGGRTDRDSFRVEALGNCVLNELYGIGQGDVGDLVTMATLMDGRLPFKFFQIGEDPGGNVLLLATPGSGASGVYFFDHESEPDDASQSWHTFPNLYKVADSFSDFLNQLKKGN